MWERDPSSSLYLRNSSLFSEFGWRQSSSPLEMEKKNAHCPGCQPHPCSNSEALDLNSKGGAKMTGSREFFFNFSFIEWRKKFTVVPLVAAVSVCRNSRDRSTDTGILVPGPAVQVFPAVHPTFQDGSMFLCSVSWSGLRGNWPRLPLVLTFQWFS